MSLPLGKHPAIAATAVLITGLLVWGFWPQAVFVEAIAVKRAPLTVAIEEEGRTRVIDRYIISAPVDGVACRVQLDVGDPVETGPGAAGHYAAGIAGAGSAQPGPGRSSGICGRIGTGSCKTTGQCSQSCGTTRHHRTQASATIARQGRDLTRRFRQGHHRSSDQHGRRALGQFQCRSRQV